MMRKKIILIMVICLLVIGAVVLFASCKNDDGKASGLIEQTDLNRTDNTPKTSENTSEGNEFSVLQLSEMSDLQLDELAEKTIIITGELTYIQLSSSSGYYKLILQTPVQEGKSPTQILIFGYNKELAAELENVNGPENLLLGKTITIMVKGAEQVEMMFGTIEKFRLEGQGLINYQ